MRHVDLMFKHRPGYEFEGGVGRHWPVKITTVEQSADFFRIEPWRNAMGFERSGMAGYDVGDAVPKLPLCRNFEGADASIHGAFIRS
jgi:hypothetical protein